MTKPLPPCDIGGRKVRLTRHAIDRALDMAVDTKEIVAALTRPKYVRPHPEDPALTGYQKGRLTLLTATDPQGVLVVITIMWSGGQLWRQDFELADYPPEAGRTNRMATA